MRILVLGGYGLIGSAIVRRLTAGGHEVVGLGRHVEAARRVMPDADWIAADLASMTRGEDWLGTLRQARPTAIVNAAGVLQDGARDNVERVQSRAMQALYGVARAEGVTMLVQISATRATPSAGTAFMRTKADADRALRASDLDWTILKPGLVLAPQAYGGTALLRGLAAIPLVQPLVLADRPVQTVHVDDVADAVLAVIEGRVAARADYDLVEDRPHALRYVVARFRGWLGVPPAPEVGMPGWAAAAVARFADALGWLGWRAPLRSTALAEIAAGVTGDPTAWREAGGAAMRSLDDSLRTMPATVQERWFARLFFVKPPAIGVLSIFWIATGLVTLARPEVAADVLATRGVGPTMAMTIALGGAVVDIALGVGILVHRWLKAAAQGMIAVTLGYLIGGTWLAPDLWLDPLGALVKAVPAMVLAGVVLAVAEDR